MIRKSGTLSLLWTSGREAALTHKGISTLVLGLSALALAVVAALLVMSAIKPGAPSSIASGVEASAARLNALARYYGAKTANLERSAAASAARWNGLATAYALDSERAAAASAARWNGLAAAYALDSGRAAAASSARYQGLADWYARKAGSGG
jgi:hypothetical protein